jgi:hypothetical protein
LYLEIVFDTGHQIVDEDVHQRMFFFRLAVAVVLNDGS